MCQPYDRLPWPWPWHWGEAMKKLIGSDVGRFVFDPASKTITFHDMLEIGLENVLVITNVTAGTMLYNFADPALGGALVGNVLTLEHDTTAMQAGDSLQVWVDIPVEHQDYREEFGLDPDFVTDTNLMQVFGTAPLIEDGMLKGNTRPARLPRKDAVLDKLNREVRIPCEGMNTVGIQLSGVWVGTVAIEGSINGADFLPLSGVSIGAATSFGSTSTSNQAMVFNCAGLSIVRCRYYTYTSGQCWVSMIADAGKPVNPAWQTTQAVSVATIDGMFTPAHTELPQQVISPAVNPARPTSYAPANFSAYPQRYRRLRVQIGGDKDLPCAQEDGTNKLIVAMPDIYSKIEELLLQQALTNQLLAKAFNLSLPLGMDKSIT